MKPNSTVPLIIASIILLQGCATAKDSVLLGASLGAVTAGGLANHASAHDHKITAMGALTGAGFGALIGYLGHKDKTRSERQKRPTSDQEVKGTNLPRLTEPRYRSIWIPDKIEGDRYIEGHRVYIIEEGAQWTID
jgi:hypothetical protein